MSLPHGTPLVYVMLYIFRVCHYKSLVSVTMCTQLVYVTLYTISVCHTVYTSSFSCFVYTFVGLIVVYAECSRCVSSIYLVSISHRYILSFLPSLEHFAFCDP